MMLIYAALLNIPDDLIDAATVDGANQWHVFWCVKLPLILPTLGIVSILTFVGNFNAFDLIYAMKGALAGPNFSTDILGTFFYRTFFGYQLQLGNPTMGATVATMMFLIILIGVLIYLFGVQRRLQRTASDDGTRTARCRGGTRIARRTSTAARLLSRCSGALSRSSCWCIVNSFKTRKAIFGTPLALPTPDTFSLIGYDKVFATVRMFGYYFVNSLITSPVVSLASSLLIGAMAAWALTEYKFRGNTLLALYLAIGIMVPIRLGTVSILQLDGRARPRQHADRADPRLHGAGPAARDPHPRRVHRSRSRAICATRRAATGSANTGSSSPSSCPSSARRWRRSPSSPWCRSGTISGSR